jgi:hypothetical protein
MPELNQCRAVDHIADEGYDTLSVVDLGDTISVSQVDDDNILHTIILSHGQALKLLGVINAIIS